VPGREHVAELQRARIVAAMVELVRERGVPNVTVAHVVARSGVSRRTFYEQFEDRGGCLLAAFEDGVEQAAASVLPAYRAAGVAGGAWEEQLREGLQALLELLDARPALGGLCIVDVLAGERRVLERRTQVVDVLIGAVHRGGAVVGGARRPPRIVAEGAVGAVLAVIHARLCAPNPRPLTPLLNQLMEMIVLPYRGPEPAARELERPVPRTRRRPAAPADPLSNLDMRLTYRTVRVLQAISDLGAREPPGSQAPDGQASNGRAPDKRAPDGRAPNSREVADAAGISDQGQISKLLWRLADLGLIANGSPTHGKGEPNAWTLTPRGRDVQQAIRAQTAG
jgi:AcrR family transcriptional regulator